MLFRSRFGVDPLRYFFLREIAFGQDGSYSPEAIVARANAELANSFGNLAQRTLSMIHKNMDGKLAICPHASLDEELIASVRTACLEELPREFERLNFSAGLEAWMRAVFACNQYVDEQAPWALRKTDPERMEAVLMTLFRCVRDLAIAVRPAVPAAADALLDQMGIADDARDYAAIGNGDWFKTLVESGFALDKPVGVFPRLELPESETT